MSDFQAWEHVKLDGEKHEFDNVSWRHRQQQSTFFSPPLLIDKLWSYLPRNEDIQYREPLLGNVINHVFFCSHLDNGNCPTAYPIKSCDYFYFWPIVSHTCVTFFVPPVHTVGCGGGRRREFHHAVLHPNGWRGLPHPDRDAGYILPRGPISERCNHQAPQTRHFRPCHMPCHGVSHQGLLPGRHAGRTQGK